MNLIRRRDACARKIQTINTIQNAEISSFVKNISYTKLSITETCDLVRGESVLFGRTEI